MTQKQQIIYDHLQHCGYHPETVYYKTTLKSGCGWHVVMMDGQKYYLGVTLDRACYNINKKLIKEMQNNLNPKLYAKTLQ